MYTNQYLQAGYICVDQSIFTTRVYLCRPINIYNYSIFMYTNQYLQPDYVVDYSIFTTRVYLYRPLNIYNQSLFI